MHKFNSVYGETLTEPEIILPSNQACLRLPGIDGKAKMSKSLGNCIYLSDEPEEIKKKIMSMFTDPNHLRVEDPGKVEGNPVFIYLDAFCKPEYFEEFWKDYSCLDEVKAHYQRGGLGDVKVKKFLNNVMQEEAVGAAFAGSLRNLAAGKCYSESNCGKDFGRCSPCHAN